MVLPLIPIAGLAVGGLAVTGVGLAYLSSEIQKEEDIGDKLELMLIRVGYVSEGVIKGSLVAVPTSLLVLLAFNSVMKLQDRVK